jgi:translocation protein SEC63
LSSRKWRVQFQAPPQVATYIFDFHVKNDSYYGTDIIHQVVLQVQDVSKLEEKSSEDIIPEFKNESESHHLIIVNLRFY